MFNTGDRVRVNNITFAKRPEFLSKWVGRTGTIVGPRHLTSTRGYAVALDRPLFDTHMVWMREDELEFEDNRHGQDIIVNRGDYVWLEDLVSCHPVYLKPGTKNRWFYLSDEVVPLANLSTRRLVTIACTGCTMDDFEVETEAITRYAYFCNQPSLEQV